MRLNQVRQTFIQRLGQVPLRTVLVLPFVVQIVAAVGVVGALSAYNGQRAINDLADQLLREVSHWIQQNLQAYLATPSAINRTNHSLVTQGLLRLDNLGRVIIASPSLAKSAWTVDSMPIGSYLMTRPRTG